MNPCGATIGGLAGRHAQALDQHGQTVEGEGFLRLPIATCLGSAVVSGKRPHKEMRYMGRHMTDEDMRVIAEYYASLPKQ